MLSLAYICYFAPRLKKTYSAAKIKTWSEHILSAKINVWLDTSLDSAIARSTLMRISDLTRSKISVPNWGGRVPRRVPK